MTMTMTMTMTVSAPSPSCCRVTLHRHHYRHCNYCCFRRHYHLPPLTSLIGNPRFGKNCASSSSSSFLYLSSSSSSSFLPTSSSPLLFSRRNNNYIFSCTTSSGSSSSSSSSSSMNLELDEAVNNNNNNNNNNNVECVGTGLDAECLVSSSSSYSSPEETTDQRNSFPAKGGGGGGGGGREEELLPLMEMVMKVVKETGVLVSPFFFWGTAMVAMKEVLASVGPFFVAAFRLIPAGFLLVAFAAAASSSSSSKGKQMPFPSGFDAWLSITLFALVDASFFQGFLAQGLQRTSAGLGSVIIDSQPLTVAVLASLLFGESIGLVGAAGLVLGVIGLLLLEANLLSILYVSGYDIEFPAAFVLSVPALNFNDNGFSLWGSGEWWMLLSAQSMAVGTVMVRWVSKYSDTVMATGWHMVIGGLPLLVISILNHEPAFSGGLNELKTADILALLYTSIFGSAISYGVYFYSATKGSLTKLSSLTFLTPMFASIFGFIYLGETFSPLQLVGAAVTLVAIYMVNFREAIK